MNHGSKQFAYQLTKSSIIEAVKFRLRWIEYYRSVGRSVFITVAVMMLIEAIAGGSEKILTEESVWKCHVTWMRPRIVTSQGVADATFVPPSIRMKTAQMDLPPPNWMDPDYDDAEWAYWREPHVVETLKLKSQGDKKVPAIDGEDTGIKVYEPAQYGRFRSPNIGLFCCRAKFKVDEPGKVTNLKLTVEYRGGVVVYVNGHEIGRASLTKEGKIEYSTLADAYPEDAFFHPVEKDRQGKRVPWKYDSILLEPELLKQFNLKIRSAQFPIPRRVLRKGINVLALEVHAAPYNTTDGTMFEASESLCGIVSVELTGEGAVSSSISRPNGLQVWNASVLTRISPFGFMYRGRIYAGTVGWFQRFPLSWGDPFATLAPVRMVAPRNGWCVGQVGVSCDTPIRGLRGKVSDLMREGGEKISGSSVEVLYMTFPDEPYFGPGSPSANYMDMLLKEPPAEIPSREGRRRSAWWVQMEAEGRIPASVDAGAVGAIWIRVKVPGDVTPGKYSGTLTVTAEGFLPISVPVMLEVAKWRIPDPKEFVSHLGCVHSPDTLAMWYKVQLWSDDHWRLMEKTVSYIGQIGGKVVFLPLRANTCWFRNAQSLVRWVKSPEGNLVRDYSIFDRYLDMVHKYMKPEVYCLYVVDFSAMAGPVEYSVVDSGKVILAKGPEYDDTPEAVAFWKPVIDESVQRLIKRGAKQEQIVLGMAWEGAGAIDPRTQKGDPQMKLFKKVAPELRLAQIAHFGGAGSVEIPYGYVMSVWGNKSKNVSRLFGGGDLPLKIVKHYRAEGAIDLRPGSNLAVLRVFLEWAMQEGINGAGPVGMDFWYLPADPSRNWKGGYLEGQGASNLSMNMFSTSALLAPGPDGPASTARFEMVREGLQECEARMVIEKALQLANFRNKLGDRLVKQCEEVLKRRREVEEYPRIGEKWSQGEGWRSFETSGWQNRTLELFNLAGEVESVLMK
jgi:hypothetical protein